MGNNGQQWTTMDDNGQQWTTMETMNNNVQHGQKWTTIDNNGQQSAVLHASLMLFLPLLPHCCCFLGFY